MSKVLSITVNQRVINFNHIIKAGLKHAYVSIDKNGEINLKSRRLSESEAKKIIEEKSAWIFSKIDNIKIVSPRAYQNGETLSYLGIDYPIEIIEKADLNKVVIDFSKEKFTLFINPFIENRNKNIEDALGSFYRKKAEKEIFPRTEAWAKVMQLYPRDLKVRKLKRRWGSCSYDNQIIFNYEAVKLPVEYIDYIIVHELAHIKEKNHSADFWSLVQKYLPNCKKMHKNIRDNVD